MGEEALFCVRRGFVCVRSLQFRKRRCEFDWYLFGDRCCFHGNVSSGEALCQDIQNRIINIYTYSCQYWTPFGGRGAEQHTVLCSM